MLTRGFILFLVGSTAVAWSQSLASGMGMLTAAQQHPSPLAPNVAKWHDVSGNLLDTKEQTLPEFRLPFSPKKRLQNLRLLISPGPFRGFAFAYRYTWHTQRTRTVRYSLKYP